MAAQIPDQMPALMALKRGQIEDPAFTAIYLDLVEAADWDADDPRLPVVADRLVAMIEKDAEQWSEDQVADFALDDELAALLDEVFVNAVPFARGLLRLLEDRGLDRVDQAGTNRPPVVARDQSGGERSDDPRSAGSSGRARPPHRSRRRL